MDVLAVDGSAWRSEFAQGADAERAFRPRGRGLRRALRIAGGLALVAVVLWLVPGPFAAQRAERAALRAASTAQANRLAALRREVVARPELSAAARDLL